MNDRIFLSPPYLGGEEKKFVNEAFETNWIAPLGPNVAAFEEEMAVYSGAPYTLALSSGSSAIHLALKYLGVKAGDVVFCSSFTFSGSCNPAAYENAELVFIDSEPETWNMSPKALKKAFEWAEKENKIPKAVIVVDLYGSSANWDEILPICKQYNVPVVEDSAEALGAEWNGKKCGLFGDLGIYSFNGNKIITTSGGGMVLCNSQAEREKMLFWATQSREKALHYEHKEVGYNYRLSNLCAGVGRGQLRIIDKKIQKRKEIYENYRELVKQINATMAPYSEKCSPNFWMSVIVLEDGVDPEKIVVHMNENHNVETRPAWKPMHLQPVFQSCMYFSHNDDGSMLCEEMYKHGLCLPSGEALTYEDQVRIVNAIKEIVG